MGGHRHGTRPAPFPTFYPYPLPNPIDAPYPLPNPLDAPYPLPNPLDTPYPLPNPLDAPYPLPNPLDAPYPLSPKPCPCSRALSLGFCLGTTISKKKSAWKYGYPIWLGVSPDYQGAGIGLALYQNFQERAVADGARMIFIDTQADSPAVHFWRRQGFGHAQAHVFMSKTISGHAVRGHAQHAGAAGTSDGGLVSPRGDGDSSALGRDTEGGSAIALVEVDGDVPADVIVKTQHIAGVKQAKALKF